MTVPCCDFLKIKKGFIKCILGKDKLEERIFKVENTPTFISLQSVHIWRFSWLFILPLFRDWVGEEVGGGGGLGELTGAGIGIAGID